MIAKSQRIDSVAIFDTFALSLQPYRLAVWIQFTIQSVNLFFQFRYRGTVSYGHFPEWFGIFRVAQLDLQAKLPEFNHKFCEFVVDVRKENLFSFVNLKRFKLVYTFLPPWWSFFCYFFFNDDTFRPPNTFYWTIFRVCMKSVRIKKTLHL